MTTHRLLDYYRQHSPITNPGKYAPLFDALPDDPAELARIVQGLLIYPGVLRLYNMQRSLVDNAVFGVRKIETLLERILKINDAPLKQQRPPEQRLGAICRNFAVLHVALLRHKDIPARERVGFSGYGGRFFYDHRITQYWDAAQKRWILADAMMDEPQRHAHKITFNTLDIQPTDPFHLSGDVWLKCRAQQLDPMQYGDSDTDRGMPPIRYALLHDFDALNKFELLGNDAWGSLIEKPEAALTETDKLFLDEVALVTSTPDAHFDQLQTLYAESSHGQAVQSTFREQPLLT